MQNLVRRFHPATGDTETQRRLQRAAAACVRDAKRFMGAEVSEAVTISRLGSRPGDWLCHTVSDSADVTSAQVLKACYHSLPTSCGKAEKCTCCAGNYGKPVSALIMIHMVYVYESICAALVDLRRPLATHEDLRAVLALFVAAAELLPPEQLQWDVCSFVLLKARCRTALSIP